MTFHPFLWLRHTIWRPAFLTMLSLSALVGVALRLIDGPLTSEQVPHGIVSFELAGSESNARQIVAFWEGANVLRYSALSLGLDFLFLLLYAGAIGLGALLAGRTLSRRSKWWWTGAVLIAWAVVLAAALDAVENVALVRMLLGAPSGIWPEIARWAAIPKFALIGVGLLFTAAAWIVVPIARRTEGPRGETRQDEDTADPHAKVPEISMPGLPTPLFWKNAPGDWAVWPPRCLKISAGPNTDWFVDPRGGRAIANAPTALFSPGNGDFILSAAVDVEFASTFDAGVLMLHAGTSRWAKLCFEYSPRREPMVVSVVTNGYSDDCNACVIEGGRVRFRICRIGQAFAFHYATDDVRWHLVRHFTLGAIFGTLRAGFSAQSPTGKGCTANFCDIRFERATVKDIRG